MKIDKNNIYNIVADFLELERQHVKSIDTDEDLRGYGMTSISFIQLVVELEEEYNFCLRDEDLLIEKMNTFKKLFALLQSY